MLKFWVRPIRFQLRPEISFLASGYPDLKPSIVDVQLLKTCPVTIDLVKALYCGILPGLPLNIFFDSVTLLRVYDEFHTSHNKRKLLCILHPPPVVGWAKMQH